MKIRTRVPFALSLLAASLTQSVWAVPTSGDYTTDKQNTWVQDRVGDRIGTVNMIMCIIGSMRGDAMVNQGPYVALIDQAKCEGRGDSSKSSSTSAGASNAANYMSAVVNATQATTTDPLVIKAWLHQEEDGHKATIYAYVVATDGKSSTNPNGLFKMYFCGEPDGMPGTCMFKGSLQSTAQGLSFYEDDGGNGGGTTQLFLQNDPGTDSGLGGISGVENSTPYDYTFAYDSNYFRRKEGSNPDVCFARDKSVAETSTWRYGTYNADGSRLDIANPGFSVKYQNGSETQYGYWSFWGLWLPDSALSNLANNIGTLTRKTASGDEALTITQKGGKLWKLSRQTATLNDFKNVPMMFWSNAAIGTDSSNTGPSNGNYQIQWDGTHLTATAYQTCDANGCATTALNPAVTIDSTFLSTNHINSIQMFFPSGGGNGAIDVSSGVSGTSTVSYRTRDVVPYTAADLGLHCVMNCTKSGTALTGALTTPSGTPFQDTPAWGPASTEYAYTFHAGMLKDGSADVDASTVTASALQGTSYQWGVTSGFMVADANLSDIKCDVNGTANASGDHYCGQLMDQLSTVYQWETGPNQWNKYVGSAGITIDPPKDLSLTVAATFTGGAADPGNNIHGGGESQLSKFNGNKVQLQFSGFGDLQGIPGNCVNREDNSPAASCDQNTRWVPAFDMSDGASITDGTNNYFVKYLEREMRLGKVNCSGVSLDLTSINVTLPTASLMDQNPKTILGGEPTPASTKPAVIDGLVQ